MTISKRTRTDIILTFGRQFAAGFLNLAIILIVARSLGQEGAGIFAISLLVPTVLGQVLNLGLPTSNVYFVASNQFNFDDVWSVTRDVISVIALLGTIGTIVILSYFGTSLFPGMPSSLLAVSAMIIPFLLMLTNITALFQAVEDFRSFNIAILTQPCVAFILIMALWITDGLTASYAVYAMVCSHITGLCVGCFLLSRRQRLFAATHMHATYLKQALPYGLKAYLANIVSFLNYRVDLFLVNLFLGPANAGLYTIAVRLVEQLWIISQSVSTVILPRLSAMMGDAAGKSVLTPAITRYVLWVTMIAAGGLALIAAPLIGFLFGQDFIPAAGALHILLPGVVLFSAARVLSNELAASGLVGINLALAITVLLTNTVLNVSLIPVLGLSGAAVSTSVSYTFAFVILLYLQMRRLNVPFTGFILPNSQDITWVKRRFGKT